MFCEVWFRDELWNLLLLYTCRVLASDTRSQLPFDINFQLDVQIDEISF